MEEKHGRINYAKIEKALQGHPSVSTFGLEYLLPGLVWSARAYTIIEIGVARGFTTALLAEAQAQLFDEPVMISVEDKQDRANIATEIFSHYKHGQRLAVCGNSAQVNYEQLLPELGAETCQLAYIDGGHSFRQVSGDIKALMPVMALEALWVFHDFVEGSHVLNAIQHCLPRHEWDLVGIAAPIGVPICIVSKRLDGIPSTKDTQGRKWSRRREPKCPSQ